MFTFSKLAIKQKNLAKTKIVMLSGGGGGKLLAKFGG